MMDTKGQLLSSVLYEALKAAEPKLAIMSDATGSSEVAAVLKQVREAIALAERERG